MILGTHASYEALVALGHRAAPARRRRPVRSTRSGENRTPTRGRGVDFAEVRSYQPGDDARTIDWRVTARKGRPHTKVFTEERDRHLWLLVDQRRRLCFGTRARLKSVAVAEAAARIGWAVQQHGDRVGLLIVRDAGVEVVAASHRRRNWLQALRRLADINVELLARPHAGPVPRQATDPAGVSDATASSLAATLQRYQRLLRHATGLALVCDFDEDPDPLRGALARPARKAWPLLVPVLDPLERQLPPAGIYPVSTPLGRRALDTTSRAILTDHDLGYRARLAAWQALALSLGGQCSELAVDDDADAWGERLAGVLERAA